PSDAGWKVRRRSLAGYINTAGSVNGERIDLIEITAPEEGPKSERGSGGGGNIRKPADRALSEVETMPARWGIQAAELKGKRLLQLAGRDWPGGDRRRRISGAEK